MSKKQNCYDLLGVLDCCMDRILPCVEAEIVYQVEKPQEVNWIYVENSVPQALFPHPDTNIVVKCRTQYIGQSESNVKIRTPENYIYIDTHNQSQPSFRNEMCTNTSGKSLLFAYETN